MATPAYLLKSLNPYMWDVKIVYNDFKSLFEISVSLLCLILLLTASGQIKNNFIEVNGFKLAKEGIWPTKKSSALLPATGCECPIKQWETSPAILAGQYKQ